MAVCSLSFPVEFYLIVLAICATSMQILCVTLQKIYNPPLNLFLFPLFFGGGGMTIMLSVLVFHRESAERMPRVYFGIVYVIALVGYVFLLDSLYVFGVIFASFLFYGWIVNWNANRVLKSPASLKVMMLMNAQLMGLLISLSIPPQVILTVYLPSVDDWKGWFVSHRVPEIVVDAALVGSVSMVMIPLCVRVGMIVGGSGVFRAGNAFYRDPAYIAMLLGIMLVRLTFGRILLVAFAGVPFRFLFVMKDVAYGLTHYSMKFASGFITAVLVLFVEKRSGRRERLYKQHKNLDRRLQLARRWRVSTKQVFPTRMAIALESVASRSVEETAAPKIFLTASGDEALRTKSKGQHSNMGSFQHQPVTLAFRFLRLFSCCRANFRSGTAYEQELHALLRVSELFDSWVCFRCLYISVFDRIEYPTLCLLSLHSEDFLEQGIVPTNRRRVFSRSGEYETSESEQRNLSTGVRRVQAKNALSYGFGVVRVTVCDIPDTGGASTEWLDVLGSCPIERVVETLSHWVIFSSVPRESLEAYKKSVELVGSDFIPLRWWESYFGRFGEKNRREIKCIPELSVLLEEPNVHVYGVSLEEVRLNAPITFLLQYQAHRFFVVRSAAKVASWILLLYWQLLYLFHSNHEREVNSTTDLLTVLGFCLVDFVEFLCVWCDHRRTHYSEGIVVLLRTFNFDQFIYFLWYYSVISYYTRFAADWIADLLEVA